MTKRNILSGVAAAALLLTPLALCAQGLRWDARAGAAIPAGDLADAVDPGFSFGLGLGIPLNDQIYLRLDGDGNFLSEISDDELDEEIEQFFEGGLNLWHYGPGLEFDFVDADETGVRLSAGLGGGLTTIDPDEPETDVPGVGASEATTRFTANGGLTLGVSRPRCSRYSSGDVPS